MIRKKCRYAALVLLSVQAGCAAVSTPTGREACSLPHAEIAAIEGVNREYVAAWLANDPARVEAILAEDVVMIPHHGVMPRVGREQVMAWWFPDGDVTAPVTVYEVDFRGVEGCGDMAMSYGRLERLEYEYDGKTFSNRDGNFLTVFRRAGDGSWKIAYRIWNDPVTRVDDDQG